MKTVKRWALILFTLLLTIIGAVMPYAVSRIQDTYVESQTDSRIFNPVSLTFMENAGILEVLRCLAGPHENIPLWGGKTNLTRDEALGLAEKILAELAEKGLVRPRTGTVSTAGKDNPDDDFVYVETELVTPAVAAADESNFSAVIWVWYLEKYESIVSIDDKSGKMVGASLAVSEDSEYDASISNYEKIWITADRWMSFFEEYYGVNGLNIKELESDHHNLMLELYVDMGHPDSTCIIQMYINEIGYVQFNM